MREREQEASPGPWEHPMEYEVTHGYHFKDSHHIATWIATCDAGDEDATDEQAQDNAEFIAHSREDIGRLLAAADAVLKLAKEYERKQLRLAEWRNRAQILGASSADMLVQSALASAYGEAAASLRSAIAAALTGEEAPSEH